MAEPDNIIDTDLFDPRLLELAEEEEQKQAEKEENAVRDYMLARKQAYAEVFSEGKTSQRAIDIVLFDLAWFGRMYTSTFDKRDGEWAGKLQDIKEGRREVFQRILDYTRLDRDKLFMKYTDALTK